METTMFRGLYVRPGTYDEYVIKEIQGCYGMLDVYDKVVMDIGANIGAFTRWALAAGAGAVVGFEPLHSNYFMLKKNVGTIDMVSTFQRAITSDGKPVELYYVPDGKNPGNTSTKIQRGRDHVTVQSTSFLTALSDHCPEVVKVDVEGSEYDWLHGNLPPCVKQVAVELHLTKKQWREVDAPRVIESFKDWDCLRQPKLTGGNWTTIGVWRRN